MTATKLTLDSAASLAGANGVTLGFGLALALATLSYFYHRNVYSFFERRGLKNPPVWPLVGNLYTILNADRMELVRDWTKKYGKFYGVFHGRKPKYVVADADVLREVCIKDFDAMPNHERSHLLNEYQHHFLFFMQDEHWKRVRAMQTPTFTSGKIKRMFKLLHVCADDLIACFNEHLEHAAANATSAVVNLKEIYSLYTLDCIASAAYSLKLNRQGTSSIKEASSRDEFVREAMGAFEVKPLWVTFVRSVPKRLAIWLGLSTQPVGKLHGIASRVRQLIKARRNDNRKFDDYLQILLDARLDDEVELNEMDDKENHHASLTRASLQADQAKMLDDIERANGNSGASGVANGGSQGVVRAPPATTQTNKTNQTKLTLADEEVVASAIFLFIVGLETTGSLLTCCTYALAFHLDIQERLYQTVKELAKRDETSGEITFNYESLTSSPYLDAVISESLRALSPVIELDRLVSSDHHIEKYNVTLKRGDSLLLAYFAIMNNPEYFPNPLKFDPERFMPENRHKIYPGSYCPFGLGPRHCLGMRFSLTESKVALAKVLMKYKFTPAPGTKYPPSTRPTNSLNILKNPIVQLTAR